MIRLKRFFFPALASAFLAGWLILPSHPAQAQKKGKKNAPEPILSDQPMGPGFFGASTQDLFMEGAASLLKGAYEEAASAFRKAANEKPGYHAAQYGLARSLLALNRFDEAIAPARAALQADASNYWYYETLAQVYRARGDYKQAAQTLQDALTRFPDKPALRLQLAEVYALNRQPERAAEALQHKSTLAFSERLESHKLRLLMDAKAWDAARASVARLRAHDPAYPEYFQLQHQIFIQLKQPDSALAVLHHLLAADPANGFALLTLADTYKARGDLAQSDTFLFRAFRNPEIDPAGKIGLIQNLSAFQNDDAALRQRIQTLTRLLAETHPDGAQTLLLQAKRLIADGRPDSARHFYRESLEKDPANLEIWRALLMISVEMLDFASLAKDADLALEYYPNDGALLFFHGFAGAYTGDYESAVASLRKARRMSEGKPVQLAETDAVLARIEAFTGNRAAAYRMFNDIFTAQPQNALAHYLMAELQAANPEETVWALSHARDACKYRDNYPPYMHLYGKLLLQAGEYVQAEPWLAKAASAAWNPDFFEHWGDALWKLGKPDAARAAWEKAIRAGARFDLRQKLQQGG